MKPPNPIKQDGLVGDLYEMSFTHTYLVGTGRNPKNRHNCLDSGYWCWKNALRHPQDIIKYIDRKLPS